jgi:hypothetical protein
MQVLLAAKATEHIKRVWVELLSGDAHFTGQSPQSRSVHFIANPALSVPPLKCNLKPIRHVKIISDCLYIADTNLRHSVSPHD